MVAVLLLGTAASITIVSIREILTPHHLPDALTSGAAFVGISVALVGGTGWEAALVAAGVIAANGIRALRQATADLMDRAPDADLLDRVTEAAEGVPDVLATETLRARSAGLGYYADLHVQADPALSLHDAHALGGQVRRTSREAVPEVLDVLVHMEPFEPDAV